jgi:hypothetical protein
VAGIRTRSSLTRVAVVCAVVVVLAVGIGLMVANADQTDASGPLGTGGDPVEACAAVSVDGSMTTASFRLTGSSAVTIDSFAPIEPHGLRVLGAYAVEIRGGSIGVTYGFPPTASQWPDGFMWEQRQAIGGARLAKGTVYALAIGLNRPSHAIGTARGFELKYHAAGNSYVVRTKTAVRLATFCGGN